jgi:RNA polymerase sigma-70 factor (ECF subfamily)
MLEAQQDLQSFAGDSESAFMAWLRTVIANNILNEYRYWAAKKRSGARQEMSLESSAVDEVRATEMTPLTTASERERRKRITVAIALLSDEYREVILLRNRDGLSFSDIGQKLNRTADAARMLWGRAIQKLTEQLHDQID